MSATAGLARRGRRRRSALIAGINVTPMVDLMLILLVIMMVSSTYIVAQAMKVELPRSRTTDGAVKSPATLTLQEDGALSWNKQPIEPGALDALLAGALAADPELNLVISADRSVPHGRVVALIDAARLQGIKRFAINVEQR